MSAGSQIDFSDLGGKVTGRAVRVIDKDGNVTNAPETQLPVYRARGMMPTADNPGAQKMITPNGGVTYAMPSEVDRFRASGHVAIDSQGRPIPSQSESDASQTRMMALSGLTGMPTPNMSEEDKAQF